MDSTVLRRVDFEFILGETNIPGRAYRASTTSKEGLVAYLDRRGRGDIFRVMRNPTIIDEMRILSPNPDGYGRSKVELILWEINPDGTGKFIEHGVVKLGDITRDLHELIYYDDEIMIPDRFWLMRGKKIKVSVWIPSGAFIGRKPKSDHCIPVAPVIPKAQPTPAIEEFEKTPVSEALMSDSVPTDFKIVSEKDGAEVKCHQCMLSITGKYFQKIIENSLDPGSKRNSATLPFSGKTLEQIKKYVYCREIALKETDDVEEIIDAGTMMMFPGLVKKCEKYIMENLGSKDKYDMLVLARRFGLENLKAEIFSLCPEDPKLWKKMRRNDDDHELVPEYTEFLAAKVRSQS